MPCDQVRSYTYGFERIKPALFLESLKAKGLQAQEQDGAIWFEGRLAESGTFVRGSWLNGKLTTERPIGQDTINELRRGYSEVVVKKAYSRFGWVLERRRRSRGAWRSRPARKGSEPC